jgi:hypothetical protein
VFDAQMAKTHQSQLRRPDSAGTQEMSDTDGTAREGPWDVTDNLAKSLAPQPRESWSGASPSDADASLVAEICAAIMNGSTLSSTGSNVTVAVADGMVIVQGHVKNQGEKDAIGSVAKRVLGVEHVDNQLVAQGG